MRIHRKTTHTLLIIGLLLSYSTVFMVLRVNGDLWDPYHTKEEKLDMWKTLCDAHGDLCSYEVIGKTYLDRDIWMFKFGNPNGGVVLWDGELHGNEDNGGEILYLMAKWLVESGDPKAQRILSGNLVLFVPMVNFDRSGRGNANFEVSSYGVNLNRNFENGWRALGPGSDDYSGEYAASEPETQTMRALFSKWKPMFYVNMHVGAGPSCSYYRKCDTVLSQQLITETQQECSDMGISFFRTGTMGSTGFAIGDASDLGVRSAWLIEAVGSDTAWRHTDEVYQDLIDDKEPKCRAMLIAMCTLCETDVPPSDFSLTIPSVGTIAY
jgi:hypothetical protein